MSQQPEHLAKTCLSSAGTQQDRRNALRWTAAALTLPLGWQALPTLAQEPERSLPAVGSLMALPSVALLQGGRFEAKQAQDALTVVYWWASWCPFCAVQSPYIEKLWQTHRSSGLQVLGLSVDRKPEDALAYIRRKGFSFPSAMFDPTVAKVLAKPKGLPVVLVRGRDGRVKHAEAGEMFPEDIERIGDGMKS
jgi:thiol-disulfide isomerase/thioredoxin